MARARKTDKRNKRKAASKRARARPRRSPPGVERPRSNPPDVERAMLELAQQVAPVFAGSPSAPLRAVVELLLGAHARHAAPLLEAWRRSRTDKRAALALGWAREQLRLAVVEVLASEATAERLRADAPIDALAWLVVVATEAAAYDETASGGDRVDALLCVLGP